MSSRRRDRSWERDDRDTRKDRPSRSGRSRSPRRGGDRDRRGSGETERERDRDYDHRPRRDGSPRPRSPVAAPREPEKPPPERDAPRAEAGPSKRPNLDPDAPDDGNEEGEEMDDDAGMMAMMGMSGFGTTKGKHIDGNQEGSVSVKKQRTWRQYMNRRGGFNRPLDKIK
ncbi:hypothetical protein B0H16DRAFT_1547004 [Mycena metata]|uniref:U4/U6.U5 small nuclear ribonucleoprotein 27kDa protein domain-containing protein n=1 Tax=Mycena metata TaxID=1033252 RepID=A0AAD7IZM8_9AGAR|nr:hypothetical protein B0H16DRAFT_1547004 [Mycena metata]